VLTAKQIRNGFIDFFKDQGHHFIPSSPIVPVGDDTLLFANAGMNQFKDIFLGLSSPDYRRVVNSQKCLRVSGKHNDLEEVGKDTYHHTFFEMLGNWSFNDYFKAEAIRWAWQLLTNVWDIDPDRLWATVFAGSEDDGLPRDEETEKLWIKVTSIPAERVLAFGKKDNFWEMGQTGPCGPCSEIHIDLGYDRCDRKKAKGHRCGVNAGCARFIELWNLVFIQYNRSEDGELSSLGANYVDTGAGLERITAVLQNKKSNYDTDLFMPVINCISNITGRKYASALNNINDNSFRVIADHIRALVFAITDGATPSNEGRGYVIRRILRRAARFGRELGMHEPFMYKLVPVVIECLSDAFGEITKRAEYVSMVIQSEEESFGRTLDRGIEIFNAAAKRAEKTPAKTISGEDAFQLYDTYGFPLDLTQLMAAEQHLGVDITAFEELMNQQRHRARAVQKGLDNLQRLLSSSQGPAFPKTEDNCKYYTDSCESKIIGFIDSERPKNVGRIETGEEVGIVLDKTCFYAEMGGQVGDCGVIESNDARFVVDQTVGIFDYIIHAGRMVEGSLAVGDNVIAKVNKDNRDATKKNHTATHLLQWALRQVLGTSVTQQGSLVGPQYLRFDFTWPKVLTAEQIKKIEDLIKEKIDEDELVVCRVMPRDEAEKLGAMALFGEKYGSQVRVVAIGTEGPQTKNQSLESCVLSLESAFSKEFCGGTHVERIGSIGGFKIIKEESVSAGVRRITALTGSGLTEYFQKRSAIVDELCETLKIPPEEIADRIGKLLKENKELVKQFKSASKQASTDVSAEAKKLLENCHRFGETSVVVGRLSATSAEQARSVVDMVKKKAKSAVIVFGFDDDGKAALLAGVTDDLVKKGLSAVDIVRTVASIIDGGGGGRPQMAQAGGKNPEKINDALAKAAELIKSKLANA
jgi:alanyl-tRNA synthetase